MVRAEDIQLFINSIRTSPEQLRRVWIPLALLMAVSVAILAVLFVAADASGVQLSDLTRDPAAVAGAPWYIGMLSTAGVMVWAWLFAVCLIGWRLSRSLEPTPRAGTPRPDGHERGTFLLASGILLGVLGTDDAFMLHERVIPDSLGVREYVIFLGYMLAFAVYAWRFRRVILQGESVLMGVGLGMLGGSMLIDKLASFGQITTFFEDGFKFTGAVVWGGYYTRASLSTVRSAASQAQFSLALTDTHAEPSADPTPDGVPLREIA